MSKVKLTESQLHNVIRKCINEELENDTVDIRNLKEPFGKFYRAAMEFEDAMFSIQELDNDYFSETNLYDIIKSIEKTISTCRDVLGHPDDKRYMMWQSVGY